MSQSATYKWLIKTETTIILNNLTSQAFLSYTFTEQDTYTVSVTQQDLSGDVSTVAKLYTSECKFE